MSFEMNKEFPTKVKSFFIYFFLFYFFIFLNVRSPANNYREQNNS